MKLPSLYLSIVVVGTGSAWVVPPSTKSTRPQRASSSQLYNIPPPSTTDRTAFQEYANKQQPPASFFELQQDCIRATQLAIADKELLLEVEFPPLPANVLELDDVSAYDVASANLNLAIDYAKGLLQGDKTGTLKNIAIMLPDEDEARIAIERRTGKTDDYIAPTVEVESGVSISSLRRSDESDDRIIKVGSR